MNWESSGFLHSFYTSERFREQGLASKLLESNLEDIKSNGLGIASISTKKNNHPMNHILKKFGFKEMFVTIDSVLYYEKEL